MKMIRACVEILARFFISAVFLAGAMKNILNWHETETSMINVLFDWQSYVCFSESAQKFLSLITPWVSILELLATFFMLVGGLFVLLGIKEKLGAFLLLLFLIPVTILYHPFWFIEGPARDLQAAMFLKNLAILGCLLLLLIREGQQKSKDRGGNEDGFSTLRF